jgi:hypothetical protein
MLVPVHQGGRSPCQRATSGHVTTTPARPQDFSRNEGVPGSSPGAGFDKHPAQAVPRSPLGALRRVGPERTGAASDLRALPVVDHSLKSIEVSFYRLGVARLNERPCLPRAEEASLSVPVVGRNLVDDFEHAVRRNDDPCEYDVLMEGYSDHRPARESAAMKRCFTSITPEDESRPAG